jgi:RNA polymerase sigma factor (sigma-70 family)
MGQTIAAHMHVTDAELLEASRRGERDAFGELVGRYQRVVSAVSYSRTRDRALGEDVAQETFLAAWRQLGQLREPSRLRSWLCGIARNLASKAKRRTAREVLDEPEIVARDNPFEAVCEAQAEHVVNEALSRVPETYRDVLVLYYQEQLSAREVSEALGISEAAALQRLSRGRQYLADGVTSLVEKSLRRPPRRDLRAAVLAALPAAGLLVSSRAEAATSHAGGKSMFKLKLVVAAAALVAAGTTAVVVAHRSDDLPTSAPIVATAAPVASPKAHVAAKPKLAPPVNQARVAGPEDNLPSGAIISPVPDEEPSIDDAKIKQLGLDRGPARGPKNAPVTIVMFTDLQCPYCAKSHGTLDQLFDEYPGKLRLVIKQLPVHKTAELGAEAALAADAQGKFWELDHLMIANHEDLSLDGILALAKQGGLDVAKLRADLENHTYAAQLADDKKTASALEINATPSFVINGRRVVGALPIDQIRKTIEASLKD